MLTKTPASPVVTPHSKGTQARVLLASVFGPYAQDDEFGSRASNPMELYHNQLTRAPGLFVAHVPPVVGHRDDSGEHFGAVHGARLPHPQSVPAN